jgi:ankyrin repeat protein
MGSADIVRALISAGADVNARAKDGGSAMLDGALKGDMGCVEALLAADADVNVKDSEGRTPLIWAAMGGHADCLKALIGSHANIGAKDNKGRTAIAVIRENPDRLSPETQTAIVALLIAAGAKE